MEMNDIENIKALYEIFKVKPKPLPLGSLIFRNEEFRCLYLGWNNFHLSKINDYLLYGQATTHVCWSIDGVKQAINESRKPSRNKKHTKSQRNRRIFGSQSQGCKDHY